VASTLTRFESSEFLLVGAPKTLVYAAPVDEDAPHHRIVDACKTISNYPGIFEWTQRFMMIRVEKCTESNEGHFEHLL
jgi:hypothetical protein